MRKQQETKTQPERKKEAMYKDNKEMKSLEIRIGSKGKLTKIQMRLHEIQRKKSGKEKSKIKGEKKILD